MSYYAALGAGVGGLMGSSNTLIGNIMGIYRDEQARQENYRLGELSADRADARTRALYNDLYSPKAQLQQLKEAGLSPSLFYGDGGGIAGQTGAQGTGAAGIGPSYTNTGIDPIQMAQIGLIDAQTRKTNAEAEQVQPLANATIQSLLSNAGLNEAETQSKLADTALKKVQTYIAEKTSEDVINKIHWECKKFEYAAEQTMWEAKAARQDYEFDKDTYNNRMNAIAESVVNLAADTALKNIQSELTAEQKNALKVTLKQRWEELRLEGEKIGLMKESIKNQKEYWDNTIQNFKDYLKQDLEKFGKSLKQGYVKIGADFVAQGMQNIVSIFNGGTAGSIVKGLFGKSNGTGASTANGEVIWE